jgi:septal ring factor EnvC (AmiA/AmiB activator)
MVRRIALLLILIYVPFWAQVLSLSDSLNLVQHQLDSTQKKIAEIEHILKNIELQEQKSVQRLELLQEKISLTQKMLRQISGQIAGYNREITDLNRELARTLEQQKTCQTRIQHRLIAIYKYSKIYPLQAFLTSTNLPEYYQRMIKLRIISRVDRQLLEQLREINADIKAKKNQILNAISIQEKLKAEYELRNRGLLKDQQEESAILVQIRREKSAQYSLQQELQEISNRLRTLLDELQRRITVSDSIYFEKKRGNLPWPVNGTVISQFGLQIHPRYRTKVNNTGIDIKVNSPSPVQVVADGKVAYADRFVGYGNLVIIDHGNGYFTLYGNLTSINTVVTAAVATGTVIGMVDDYLHFEVRKDGQPLNPRDWLQ